MVGCLHVINYPKTGCPCVWQIDLNRNPTTARHKPKRTLRIRIRITYTQRAAAVCYDDVCKYNIGSLLYRSTSILTIDDGEGRTHNLLLQ